MDRRLLLAGLAVLAAIAAGVLLLPSGVAAPPPSDAGVSHQQFGAAFLGLLLLVFLALGMDWRDWF